MHAGEHLIMTLAWGLSAALALGFVTHRLGLSPIVGYLLAGILIGPHTPGFVADVALASQLAEVGVILLMFGVGLHFHPRDLRAVRSVAIPGAVGQSVVATALGAAIAVFFGWSVPAALVLGAAISVASTVVLTRVLLDNDALETSSGRIAIGWLIVEDIFTVVILVLLPILADAGGASAGEAAAALGWAAVKLGLLVALLVGLGARGVPWLLNQVARSRSRELFTLAVLSVALAIAGASAVIFGASMALGAFLAGMVVGRSELSHQAAADALPMRDAFAVVFFLSVGMLFDPRFLLERPGLVLAVLGVVLIAKPLAALAIVLLLGRSVRSALTVAVGLAQIGEFSFILAETARSLDLAPPEATNVLVAAAMLSITVNPVAFRTIGPIESWLRARPRLWSLLQGRAEARAAAATTTSILRAPIDPDKLHAIVVGYGPVGQTVTELLRDFGIDPTIVELNVDTVMRLIAEGRTALYGDAGRPELLEAAGITRARYLIVTQPDLAARAPVISAARALNPQVKILTRARYIAEGAALETLGANAVCYEEAEAAVGLATLLLDEVAPEERVEAEVDKLRARFALRRLKPPPLELKPAPPPAPGDGLDESQRLPASPG
jgi:CPA2 family monovalent cation:H+ antiporter-2